MQAMVLHLFQPAGSDLDIGLLNLESSVSPLHLRSLSILQLMGMIPTSVLLGQAIVVHEPTWLGLLGQLGKVLYIQMLYLVTQGGNGLLLGRLRWI